MTSAELQEKAAGHFLDAMRISRHYPLDNLNWERAAREESRTRARDLVELLTTRNASARCRPADESSGPGADCPGGAGAAPSLSEAREAARQLGGEAATIVRRFLDALHAAPAPAAAPAASHADLPAQPLQRPPLGLRPLEFAVRDRISEVRAALHRYEQAGAEPQQDWQRELVVLLWLRDQLRRGRPVSLFC